MALFMGSIVIGSTPRLFRPLMGYIVGSVINLLLLRVLKHVLPVVKQRLEDTQKLKADPSHPWVPPVSCSFRDLSHDNADILLKQDGLQWIIDEAYATEDPRQLDVKRVAHRLIFVNDISMHSTGYTASNVIRDLVRSRQSLGYIEALRSESARVLKEAGGSWTRQAVSQLHLIDSTIRESMRLSPFFSAGLPRKVSHPAFLCAKSALISESHPGRSPRRNHHPS